MLDKTIPFYSLIMETEHPDEYPRFDLPDGFSFVLWEPGLETEWARIHTDLGQFKSIEEGEKVFAGEFLDRPELARKRCFFVKAANGAVVATASLWDGDLFGSILPRIHWVAVAPAWQGYGLAKALLSHLFDLFQAVEAGHYLYLVTQTWSFKAIHLYQRFGFRPYRGPRPQNSTNVNFTEDNIKAWDLVGERLKQDRT